MINNSNFAFIHAELSCLEICMDNVKYEVFLEVVRTGSFTAAAQEYGYTQSGVTRVITSLEQEFGFELFIRSKKGVTLTENGKIMLGPIRNLVNASRLVHQMSDDINGLVTGHLTIGAYYSITTTLLPTILRKFKALYPGVSIRLLRGGNQEMSQWLADNSVDCCLCGELPGSTPFKWIPLFRDEMLALLPPDHPFADASVFPVDQLAYEDLIMTEPNHDTDQDRVLMNAGITPNITFATQDCYATYKMVDAGLGISFEQGLLSQEWGGNVRHVPFMPPQYVSLGVAIPLKANLTPATERFIQCVKEELETKQL